MDLSQFTISGEQERINSLRLQNARLIKLRWFYITSLPWIAAVAAYVANNDDLTARYFLIGLGGVGINTVLYLVCRLLPNNIKLFQGFMVIQLVIDLSIATAVTYMSGGLQARTTAIYIVPILAAGLIFSSPVVYFTAALSGIAYASCITLYAINHNTPVTLSNLLVPAVFYPVFYLVLARLVDYLIRKTTEDTREKAYDAFLSLLSHQLKRPLSTVNAIVDQLEQNNSKALSKDKKYIQMLKSENQNLLILLNNLLETAAPQKYVGRHEEVDLPGLLQKIAYHCAERNNRVSDLKLDLHEMSLEIMGNSERLKTALANVLDNAFLYSKKGTPVTVSLKKADKNAIISIEDRGKGIDRVTQKNLFGKYSMGQPGDEGFQGLGLGLSVTEKIIKSHYGSTHIVTDKKGTKVIITLKQSTNE